MYMNKGVIKDEKVWKMILESLPENTGFWSKYANISERTIQGWKQGGTSPRKDTLLAFLEAVQKHLQEQKKEELIEKILKEKGITGDLKENLNVNARKDFVDFLNDILTKKSFLEIPYFNNERKTELLNNLILQKFQHWFRTEQHISVELMEGYKRNAFLITIKNHSKVIPPVIFSYLTGMRESNITEEEKSLNEFHDKYKENCIKNCKKDYLLHIAATSVSVTNEQYNRILKNYNVYLKAIQDEEFKIDKIRTDYIYLEENAVIDRELNIFAEVIFRKFLESSYLIYKEVLCWKYDVDHVNHNFFQSNLGIGNYPYAMRRAISFEKKVIENELKRRRNQNGKKIELFIDLNCIGGLYGLRLFQYCSQVLCVDASKRTIQAINNILSIYNKDIEERKIVNVITELFRDETMDILSNKDYQSKADCIAVGLGTMSFIKSPELLLRKISCWLKPDGVVFLSCYNPYSLSMQLKRFANLYYEYDFYNQRFTYSQDRLNIPVPVKMFSFTEFKNIIKKYFEFDGKLAWSYPVISSILSVNEYGRGMDIIKEVDKASVAYSHDQLASGNYNMVLVSQYKELYTIELYKKTKEIMEYLQLDYQEIFHNVFVSSHILMEGLREEKIIFGVFIKSVMIKDITDVDHIRYYMILLPFGEDFQWRLLEQYYKGYGYEYKQSRIKLCDEQDLRQLGFIAGSICPFSYSVLKESCNIELLYDYSIQRLQCKEIYTYSGQNNSTYKLTIESLRKYLEKMGAYTYRLE